MFVMEFRKTFPNAQALNREFTADSSLLDNINTHVILDKKFKWFYNIYTYSESYHLNQLDKIFIVSGSYSNQVLMPGLVIQTNADETNENMATWNFNASNQYGDDYTLTVESRLFNWKNIAITGTVLMLIIGYLIVRLLNYAYRHPHHSSRTA